MARKVAKARGSEAPEQEDVDDDKVQKTFAEVHSDKIDAISRTARAYKRKMNERLAVLKEEKKLKTKLIELMKQHDETLHGVYRNGDVMVTLETKDNLSVDSPEDQEKNDTVDE